MVEAAWTPFTQAVITVPSEASEHEFDWIGRGVPVEIDVAKGAGGGKDGGESVLVGTGAVEVLKSPPVIVVNAVGLGERTGISLEGMDGCKSVLVAIGAVEVLKAPPVIVVNVVGVGERTGISLVGVGDGMGVAANSA